jgi:hypothetical protein
MTRGGIWRWIAAVLGIAALGAVLFYMLLYDPVVKSGENGLFRNDLCGTIELSDGTMLLNGQSPIRYKVGRDAAGPYILPRVYVGAVPDFGFDVDGTRSIIKLRLDRLPHPTKLTLQEGLTPYVFSRVAAVPAKR